MLDQPKINPKVNPAETPVWHEGAEAFFAGWMLQAFEAGLAGCIAVWRAWPAATITQMAVGWVAGRYSWLVSRAARLARCGEAS